MLLKSNVWREGESSCHMKNRRVGPISEKQGLEIQCGPTLRTMAEVLDEAEAFIHPTEICSVSKGDMIWGTD